MLFESCYFWRLTENDPEKESDFRPRFGPENASVNVIDILNHEKRSDSPGGIWYQPLNYILGRLAGSNWEHFVMLQGLLISQLIFFLGKECLHLLVS